jgi:hypothetical protein
MSPFLGILRLDTRFPRPIGDVGNPSTFERAGIPVCMHVVQGASAQRVVGGGEGADDASLLGAFVEGARTLRRAGAALIGTSCGFLARYQAHLQSAVPDVPVLTSSLLLCRHAREPGIVTFDAQTLGAAELRGAQVPPGTPIVGLEAGCELHRRVLEDDTILDTVVAERNVVAAATQLECTNMPPYRAAVAAATGRVVHDAQTMLVQAWRSR